MGFGSVEISYAVLEEFLGIKGRAKIVLAVPLDATNFGNDKLGLLIQSPELPERPDAPVVGAGTAVALLEIPAPYPKVDLQYDWVGSRPCFDKFVLREVT